MSAAVPREATLEVGQVGVLGLEVRGAGQGALGRGDVFAQK